MYDVLLQISLTVSEKRLPSTHSSTYEMRKSSHTRLASGQQTQHIELDTKGKPMKIGTQL